MSKLQFSSPPSLRLSQLRDLVAERDYDRTISAIEETRQAARKQGRFDPETFRISDLREFWLRIGAISGMANGDKRDGALDARLGGRPTIFLNELGIMSAERILFTLAHEIGHFFTKTVHHPESSCPRDEAIVNLYAAILLMPDQLVSSAIKTATKQAESPEDASLLYRTARNLAEKSGCSLPAATRRLVDGKLEDGYRAIGAQRRALAHISVIWECANRQLQFVPPAKLVPHRIGLHANPSFYRQTGIDPLRPHTARLLLESAVTCVSGVGSGQARRSLYSPAMSLGIGVECVNQLPSVWIGNDKLDRTSFVQECAVVDGNNYHGFREAHVILELRKGRRN